MVLPLPVLSAHTLIYFKDLKKPIISLISQNYSLICTADLGTKFSGFGKCTFSPFSTYF